MQSANPALQASKGATEGPHYDLIELLFFAYRDFVSDPDLLLAEFGFGRAHHRVLHFVSRRPGLTIAEILDILRITKQSLNRVLKELIETGFVESRPGTLDRRQRLLHSTAKGDDLATKLAALQTRRISRAIEGLDHGSQDRVRQFLLTMIDESDRGRVAKAVLGSRGFGND